MTPEDYEAKQAAKKARYEELAESHRQQSDARYNAAKQLGDMIPFGQPILVGHHSERGHRADLKRINTNMRKAVEHGDTAKYYDCKADRVGKGGVSADDPEAVQKLKAKLEKLEKTQTMMKAVNSALRLQDKVKGNEKLRVLGISDNSIDKLRSPDYVGHVGFPPYRLTNNNANMRRIRERIASLEAREGQVTETFQHGDIGMIYNAEENRLQLVFPGKPSDRIRTELKYHGFRWSPTNKAWQRQLNSTAKMNANSVLSYIRDELNGEWK